MNLKMPLQCVLILSVFAVFIAAVSNAAESQPKPPKLTGTFSSLYYNEEGGDVLGAELRISYTRNGYQGTFQYAEGSPEALVLVDVHYDKDVISFDIPKPNLWAGKFTGKISDAGITGKIDTLHEEIRLKRGKSYWD